jgi:hypothetical protein
MRYDRVDRAIAEGKLWRAKEILEGRLGAPDFDRELLLRYGKVLLAMGDLIAAGRALFFSGSRDPEFCEAIRLFLARHPRTDSKRFVSGMPLMVRRQTHLAEYLASDEFAKLGWSASALALIEPRRAPVKRERLSRSRQRLQSVIAGIVGLAFSIIILAGLISVGKLIFSSFR